MTNLFYRNRRLLCLAIALILVSGLSAIYVLPRMEDPLLSERAANVNTLFPGADAQRVEALVTEKLEEKLREIEEIKEVRSSSRVGVSTISLELHDDVDEVDPVWSRVRDKLDDAAPQLPAGCSEPEFNQLDIRAYALIVAVTWQLDSPPNYALLRRWSEQLEDVLRAVPGTEEVRLYGDPREEIRVEIQPAQLAALQLTVEQIAQQLSASDAKIAAGQLRSDRGNLLMDVDTQLDNLGRVGATPIRFGSEGEFVQLQDIACIERGIADPPGSMSLIDGRSSITLGVLVRASTRLDRWAQEATDVLAGFQQQLPAGLQIVSVFQQNPYVQARLAALLLNLLLGALAVTAVILLLMGWRSAIVVAAALPMSALMVLSGLRFLGIPIQQMSVIGLIIALGMLIDNAIVMVDEVKHRLGEGEGPALAVSHSVRRLFVPLLGSTLTTALAFGPIALMPGPTGEFVSAMAISVILAICSSLLLAMTIVPALASILETIGSNGHPPGARPGWWRTGVSSSHLTRIYRRSLDFVFQRPAWGIALGILFPLLGFFGAHQLPEQFFPPADRDQLQMELELSPQASLTETLLTAQQLRQFILAQETVQDVHWFLGESAPSFYYNVIPRRKATPRYAQALVQLHSTEDSRQLIRSLQTELDAAFPHARVLLRQLEQGPPFNAPIEIRLFGPDLKRLRQLGQEIGSVLARTSQVIHVRAEMSEALPKLAVRVDEEQARLAGLDHQAIARQLNATLEGAIGGSVLEATEEMPVRVRVSNVYRGKLSNIESLDLLGAGQVRQSIAAGQHAGVPLSALAQIELRAEEAAIPHFNGRRMNEIQGFVVAGVLPSEVLAEFQQRLQAAGFQLPPGYELRFGGENAGRNDAIRNLMANVGVLLVLMAATLVLSFNSFRMAGIIGTVAVLSVGLGLGSLWLFGFPFGFMAVIGTMGLMGVAINDSIVVLAGIKEDEHARRGDPETVRDIVLRATRHVIGTTLTTMVGFLPLVLGGGSFWPPLAITIAAGVGGSTLLALYFVPSAHLLLCRRQSERVSSQEGAGRHPLDAVCPA